MIAQKDELEKLRAELPKSPLWRNSLVMIAFGTILSEIVRGQSTDWLSLVAAVIIISDFVIWVFDMIHYFKEKKAL
ncbi:hypothetical protein GMA7_70 [Gordonia phage GMA7]|uniref:Uncharacterized protein n=1 Tax=Gordonia phage GMA7 TaxID=1647286 RepID=A0A0K0N6Z5_9CAUD|nr:hypothetical protein AU104_gp048 [Gordonia phage GMA7]AKJ72507.1 hypothetical protein GMA7_70 [Gordonia phage GMA7]QSL99720.1 hypothetical protein SEA_AUSTIN_80 [Gordonia phage Austin]